jgi:hypothetical protein
MKQRLQFLLAFLIVVTGCTTPKSAMDNASKGNEEIPKSFNPGKVTLLIEGEVDSDNSSTDLSTTMSVQTDTYMNAYMTKNQKAMMEYADKNYPYKHKFTTQKEIYGTESKYSDRTEYQYALVTSLVKPNQYMKMNTTNGQFQSTHNQPIFRYYLYDRLNDKTYSSLGNGSSLVMWAFKSAIKRLNDVK